MKKPILLAPLDPVHDIGLKIMNRALNEHGYTTVLLPPDSTPEEIIKAAIVNEAGTILISRTLGYGVADLLANFVDVVEAAGLRETVKLGIGGMAIRPELAAELGFDGGFGPGTKPAELLAFVEGRPYIPDLDKEHKEKKDITAPYDYHYHNSKIEKLLDLITDRILAWTEQRTSPGVERAILKEKILEGRQNGLDPKEVDELQQQYLSFCDQKVKDFYQGRIPAKTRPLSSEELISLEKYVADTESRMSLQKIQHYSKQPVVFIQYGTGCPFMDIAHIKAGEAWGADGVVHFDPSWGARTEGFLSGYLTHEEDGSIITEENLTRIKQSLSPSTLWQVRAHRGVNTPETVMLAGWIGADLTKINIAYGAMGAGTDPARMTVDGVAAIKYAAKYNMPFDVVTNEELSGVPAHKAFAGMLVTAHLGIKLGARPVLQPLFAYSPEQMINGGMEDNYVDFNVAKVLALRSIINAPMWPGAPVGFLTQTEDRVQSSMSTGLHAALAASLQADAISIASADEAYSGGPISMASRIDTLRAVQEAFRFFGQAGIQPTGQAEIMAEKLSNEIEKVLEKIADAGCLVEAMYQGLLGSKEDGAYPGRAGKDTVTLR